jgi:hypothetical protein
MSEENKNLMLFQHPSLPDQWDYYVSVKKMQQLIYKWKNLTRDVANELWIARENLASRYHRDGTNVPSWSQYCEDIGIAKRTANRWLVKWFPESLDLEIKPQVDLCSYDEWLPEMEQADLLLTDPPYQTDLEEFGLGDVYSFAHRWLPIAFDKLKPTARAYICVGAYPNELAAYLSVAENVPFRLANILVWTYQNTIGVLPTHDYKLNWQAVLHFVGPDAPPLRGKELVDRFTVMSINAPDGRQGDRYHEWQKPLELADKFIKHATEEGDLVLDPFVGSGTFPLAANRLGRRGFGCDIAEMALDIAQKRGCEIV